ncbi:MAG: EF-hand domain-containing protein, partial [Gemmataceae bacterium]|nr:EF-hand domain-containing protein [Gemmataceae bacterium]
GQPVTKHDPLVDAQLRVSFGRMDSNKDGFLDDVELARAFRGPKARPAPMPAYNDKGEFVMPSGQAGLKYPDQVYLLALDQDGDGRVSWAEFDSYGEAYAAQFKSMQRLNQQALRAAYAQAQRNLAVRRNANYSRYGRPNYYRPARSHRGPATISTAYRVQDQRHMLQDQLHRLQDQRRSLNYSPSAARPHRPVKNHSRHPGGR